MNREKLINISLFNSSLYKQLKIPHNLYNKTPHNLISTKAINDMNCLKIMDSLVIVFNQINILLFYIFQLINSQNIKKEEEGKNGSLKIDICKIVEKNRKKY